MAKGSYRPQGHGDQVGHKKGEHGQFQGHRQSLHKLRTNRDPVLERLAKVAGQGFAEPVCILHIERTIQAILSFETHDGLRRGIDSQGRTGS